MAGEAQRRSQWPLALTLLVGATGLVILTFYNWRNGIFTFAGAVALGALLRVTMSDAKAGLLHVRSRAFDTTFLFLAAAAITLLGLIIPD
jgi:hypothetical protein